MTKFGHSGGGFLAGKQVFPVDCEAEVSQRLIEACHGGDLKCAFDCIADPFVDVNFVGTVCFKSRRTEVLLHEEAAHEVQTEYEEFKMDVTALFLAVHAGNITLVRKLLSVGADVNQKLFRGFATTAAVREGQGEILEILLKAGASQPACEEALLEASCHGRASLAELLMGSDMIKQIVAVHALVTASCRGFTEVVDTLIKCGVDANSVGRVLLRSSKPALHTNVDCNALVAAIVSRQCSVVRHLLQAGVRTDIRVNLGAWSWDTASGEEFRVGAGLAEPYGVLWCAVEYFEATGTILRLLLEHHSSNAQHRGRTLVNHAILCNNAGALDVLIDSGADAKFPVKTKCGLEFQPIHLAARLGVARVLQRLISAWCDLNARTESGETALMLCAKWKRTQCARILVSAGADLGLVDNSGQNAVSVADGNKWGVNFRRILLDVILNGKNIRSSDPAVFSPLMFVTRSGDVEALQRLIEKSSINLNEQDENGFTAVMVAAMEGLVEAFRALVFSGANVKLCNNAGQTAIMLSEVHKNRDLFEKVMLEFTLEKGSRDGGFYALHCASRRGDFPAVQLLTSRGYDVNVADGDGYTPLMLAAREGHARLCEFLISCGADCQAKNSHGETPLLLARKNRDGRREAEGVILDELARVLVLSGGCVGKHTKQGKGAPHAKEMKVLRAGGVLRWGKASRRNVVCKEVELGGSEIFRRNRGSKGDANLPGLFRIVTTKNREVHFFCEDAETAGLWVRGIKLISEEAVVSNNSLEFLIKK